VYRVTKEAGRSDQIALEGERVEKKQGVCVRGGWKRAQKNDR